MKRYDTVLLARFVNKTKRSCVFSFFQELTNVIQNLHFDDIVLCGDFNCVLNNDSDVIRGENHAEGTGVNDMNECNLFHTRRLFNPDIKGYTWSKRKEIHLLPEDWIIF